MQKAILNIYTDREVRWQIEEFPKLLEAGIVQHCESPWAARCRWVARAPGEDGAVTRKGAVMRKRGGEAVVLRGAVGCHSS